MQHDQKSPQSKGPFKASKEAVHDEVHAGGHGGTEMGWLVSYADMMTLLFGLFVILFSLTTDKSKSVDEVMKDVSQKYFRTPNQTGYEEAIKPEAVKPTPEPQHKIETKVEIKEVVKEVTKVQVKEVKVEVESKVQAKKIAVLEDEIKKISASTETLKSENQGLKDELAKEKNKTPMQSYMMILISWETEKHDLDLKVTTPDGKTFDFKKRSIASVPGSFVLDSRYGPGVEMWRAENFKPGKYKCKIALYNKNGNKANAKFQLNVMTNLQNYKTPQIELSEVKTTTDISFEVDKEGVVQLLN